MHRELKGQLDHNLSAQAFAPAPASAEVGLESEQHAPFNETKAPGGSFSLES